MSASMAEVLAAHHYRPLVMECSCMDEWLDTEVYTLDRDEFAAHQAEALAAAGYGAMAEVEAKLKYAIESEERAWRSIDGLYSITPTTYNLGDGKVQAIARAIEHLRILRSQPERKVL